MRDPGDQLAPPGGQFGFGPPRLLVLDTPPVRGSQLAGDGGSDNERDGAACGQDHSDQFQLGALQPHLPNPIDTLKATEATTTSGAAKVAHAGDRRARERPARRPEDLPRRRSPLRSRIPSGQAPSEASGRPIDSRRPTWSRSDLAAVASSSTTRIFPTARA